jgi:predicted O-methyltransferase YrrM
MVLSETKPAIDAAIVSGNPYLGNEETAILLALIASVAPVVMLEFGVNRGITARHILNAVPTIERYLGIDVPHDHRPPLACQHGEVPAQAGEHALDDPRFELLLREHGSRDLVADDLPACDAAFIDGDHSYKAVLHDSALARARVRPGGIVVWHDYTNAAVEVTPALDQLAADGWPIRRVDGTWLALMRRMP